MEDLNWHMCSSKTGWSESAWGKSAWLLIYERLDKARKNGLPKIIDLFHQHVVFDRKLYDQFLCNWFILFNLNSIINILYSQSLID